MAIRASIGQYFTGDSPIHRLDARVKICAALALMAGTVLAEDAPALVLSALVVCCAVAISRVPAARFFRQTRAFAAFFIVTALASLVLTQTGRPVASVGVLEIRTGGIAAAGLYTVRFLLLLLSGELLMAVTPPTQLTDGLEALMRPLERLGAPTGQIALTLSIALRFVPTLSSEAESIVSSQAARGADIEGRWGPAYARACLPLIVPLFASAIRHADALGRAMDARCYTPGPGRTHLHAMHLDARRDGPFIAAAGFYLAAALILKILP